MLGGVSDLVDQIRAEYASGHRWRGELLDEPHIPFWNMGRHVVEQVGEGPLEFFYIEREGGYKEPPRLTMRVARWFDEVAAERKP